MLARTADNLFWMSRYMERIDFITKVLLVGFSSTSDYHPSSVNNFEWEILAKMFFTNQNHFCDDEQAANQVFQKLVVGDEQNSLKELITKARENARGVQEHISKEVWESINKKYHKLLKVDVEKIIVKEEQLNFLFDLFDENLKYSGVVDGTNHRGEGWNFMNLGKFCERTVLVLGISEEKYKNPIVFSEEANNILFWKNFLLCLSGFELYIKDYRSGDNSRHVLDMIVYNKQFTRSISYSVDRIRNYLTKIIQENPNPNNNKVTKEIGMMSAKINYSDLDQLVDDGVLHFFQDAKRNLFNLNQTIGQIFFSYY